SRALVRPTEPTGASHDPPGATGTLGRGTLGSSAQGLCLGALWHRGAQSHLGWLHLLRWRPLWLTLPTCRCGNLGAGARVEAGTADLASQPAHCSAPEATPLAGDRLAS